MGEQDERTIPDRDISKGGKVYVGTRGPNTILHVTSPLYLPLFFFSLFPFLVSRLFVSATGLGNHAGLAAVYLVWATVEKRARHSLPPLVFGRSRNLFTSLFLIRWGLIRRFQMDRAECTWNSWTRARMDCLQYQHQQGQRRKRMEGWGRSRTPASQVV